MRKAIFLVLLLLLFLALLQGAFLPLNLVLLTVLFFSFKASLKTSLWLAFTGGLFLDLSLGTHLGFSSLYLLVLVLLVNLLSSRFNTQHPVFLMILVFLSASFYSWLAFNRPAYIPNLILVGLALGIKLLLNKLRI
jgi:rod shape-determining protein MreD